MEAVLKRWQIDDKKKKTLDPVPPIQHQCNHHHMETSLHSTHSAKYRNSCITSQGYGNLGDIFCLIFVVIFVFIIKRLNGIYWARYRAYSGIQEWHLNLIRLPLLSSTNKMVALITRDVAISLPLTGTGKWIKDRVTWSLSQCSSVLSRAFQAGSKTQPKR